ncbi:MAG TPA: glycosyltransferase [Bryobacteraceae bacterium]|nr:glycosyltransferase [Bryobacteraceae bacterium]
MRQERLRFVFFGLSITSSWGNGHATTYRGLVRELASRGHDVLFLERDVPWYAENRDLPEPPYGRTLLYSSLTELKDRFTSEIANADIVIIGSYVPEGLKVGEWITSLAQGITAFYDIDTPVTLSHLESGDVEYLSKELIPRFDLYLSFTGGPTLRLLERHYRAKRARVLYCSADPDIYRPADKEVRWDLGYLGTYSPDRQPTINELLLRPARECKARRFAVAGPLYPESLQWPANVHYSSHVAPADHRNFYNSQRFTLNVTRQAMIKAGYSPSVRLFEAAACGVPIITDLWRGLASVFKPGREILVARSGAEVVKMLTTIPEERRIQIGRNARQRVLKEHTAAQRASLLEHYFVEAIASRPAKLFGVKLPADQGFAQAVRGQPA